MKMYVVSGGPGTGKTSTVEELGKEFQILPEAARDVSQNDSRFVGKSIKEVNPKEFQDAIFEEQKRVIDDLKGEGVIFSDRGVGDTMAYRKLKGLKISKEMDNYFKKVKYAEIFILDFLDFYEQDELRQENEEEQKQIHQAIIDAYKELGYEPVIVPFMSVKKRVEFIKSRM